MNKKLLLSTLLTLMLWIPAVFGQTTIDGDTRICSGTEKTFKISSKDGDLASVSWSTSDSKATIKTGKTSDEVVITFSSDGKYTVTANYTFVTKDDDTKDDDTKDDDTKDGGTRDGDTKDDDTKDDDTKDGGTRDGDTKDSSKTVTIDVSVEDCCDFPATISGSDTVCQGASVPLSASGLGSGYSYSWSITGGTMGTSSGAGPHYATFNSTGNQTVTLTVTEDCSCNGCPPKTITKTIYVKPSPTVSVSHLPGGSCNYIGDEQDFSVSVSSGATVNWSFSGATGSGDGSGGSATWNSPGLYQVCVTASLNGCDATDCESISVIDNTCPSASFNLPSEICQFSPLTISASNQGFGTNYNWSLTGANSNNGSGLSINRIFTTSGNQTVTLTVSKCGCTDEVLTKTIFVKPTPQTTVSGEQCVVVNGTETYTHTTSGLSGVNYLWNFNGGNGTVSNNTADVSWSTTGLKNLCVTAELNGCVSTNCLPITVIPATCPTASFNIPSKICLGEDLALNAANQGFGTNYQWSATSGVLSNANGQNANLIFNQVGTYNITLTVSNCNCSNDVITKSIEVSEAPVVTVTGPSFGITGANYTFSTTYDADYSYSWTINNVAQASSSESLTTSFATPGWQTICVYVTHIVTGCSTIDCFQFGVVENDCPEAIINGSITVCQGDTFNLSATDMGCGVDYFWNIGGTTYNSREIAAFFNNPGSYSGSLYVTTCGCNDCENDTTYFTLTVLPAPEVVVSGPTIGVINNSYTFFTAPQSGVTYSWTVEGSSANSTTNSITASWATPGTYEVCVTVSLQNGCDATDCISIEIGLDPVTPCLLDSFNFGNLGLGVDLDNQFLVNTTTIVTFDEIDLNTVNSNLNTSTNYDRNLGDTTTYWSHNIVNNTTQSSKTCFSMAQSVESLTFSIYDLDFLNTSSLVINEYARVEAFNNGTQFNYTVADYSLGAFATYDPINEWFTNNIGLTSSNQNLGDVNFEFTAPVDSICIEFISFSSQSGSGATPVLDLGISNIKHCDDEPLGCLFPAILEFSDLGLNTDLDGGNIISNFNSIDISFTPATGGNGNATTSTNYVRNGITDTTAYIVQEPNGDTTTLCFTFGGPTEAVSFYIQDLDYNDDADFLLEEYVTLTTYLNNVDNTNITASDYTSTNYVTLTNGEFSQSTQMVNANQNDGDVLIHLTYIIDKFCIDFYGRSEDRLVSAPDADYGISDISCCTNLPVPVTWLSINAKKLINDKVAVVWSTSSELNNDKFEVERSIDGLNFEYLGVVSGNGTSSVINNYQFIDQNPFPGISYYRIKQIDYDGTSDFSERVSINFDIVGSVIYPNPNKENKFTLELAKNIGNVSAITISDLYGNSILKMGMEPNETRKVIDIANLRNGVYLVSFESNGVVKVHKLIVSR